MVATQMAAATLHSLFERMNACAHGLEDIAKREHEAVHRFDAEALMQLADMRKNSHQELGRLESQCRELMRQCQVPDSFSLEAFIDVYAVNMAVELQAIRRELYKRLARLTQTNEEHRLRLQAANDVVDGILQHIGLKQAPTTYGPGGAL